MATDFFREEERANAAIDAKCSERLLRAQTYQSFALQRTTAFRYNPLSWKTPTQYYLYYQIA